MDTWYSVDLGDGVTAYGYKDKIQEVFLPLFAASGYPKDMAVFSKYPIETNIITVFFTPSAYMAAKIFNASPCEKPSSDGIGLLVGDERSWDIFFPDRNRV